MDLKPIVTNFGDEKLYVPLSKEIERRLPSKSVEWKRSFGRSSKTVCLKATFTKYNSDMLKGTSEGSVNKQPFLHIYWTACMENDDFRNGIKQRITNWQQNLISQDINDWLVIQVVSQDASKPSRSKLTLPRSSVFDKIRNDICGRNSSRCAQLWEPEKETLSTKSAESWETLVSHLRELLLDSISRHLTKFEEKVRNQREKYAEPNWSFVDYLKLNEELATIFKSVTLHEDALIQYDELDALFSQFVVNAKIKGKPPWLEHFTNKCKTWDGISLNKHAVKFYRDLVYEGKATLLELRNYIFIRQWQMLSKINKDADVVHRLLEFLFAVVNEVKILQPGCAEFIPACWAVSTCLEFMKIFERKEIGAQPTIACLAQISDYAREKILLLGKILNLLPSDAPSLSSNDVTSGLCKSYNVKDDAISGSKSLMIGLSSKTEFEKLYLHACERTKALYTNVGRHRFAMKVAIDIAKFSLQQDNYDLAESYLENALHTFGKRQWETLHIDVLEPLAICLCKHDVIDRYLWSLACLSCTKTLTYDKRLHYAQEFLNITRKDNTKPQVINTEPVIGLEEVKIDLVKEIGHIGEAVSVTLKINSHLPLEFSCDQMEIRLRYTQTDSVRLSEVDGDVANTSFQSDASKWSEVFKRPTDDTVSSTERKVGLLQRIRSRRVPRQPDVNSDVNDDTSAEKSPIVENGDVMSVKQFYSSKVSHRRTDSNASTDSNGGRKSSTTLSDLAKGISFSREVSEDQMSESTPNSFDYSRMLREGIGKRSDSVSSCLSNISIASESPDVMGENNAEGECLHLEKDQRSECSDMFGEREADSSQTQKDCTEYNALVHDIEVTNHTDASMDIQPNVNGMGQLNTLQHDSGVESCTAEENEVFTEEVINSGCCGETENKPGNSTVEDIEQELIEEIPFEEEAEMLPAQKLIANGIILKPGSNSVSLSAKVFHEGRYNLKSLSCKIGNVTLYHLLTLPRKSRAFFVISDPPKFSWTSTHLVECLLLGSKQRIHVTLSNGPGYIPSSSVVRITTTTGLEFSSVPASSVFVYKPNNKDESKEGEMQIESTMKNSALLYLPECGAYEMIDIFFDVTAPVPEDNLFGHMVKHEVSLECLWLNDLANAITKLESNFYEPFSIEHEFFISSNGEFVHSILRNMNPVQITIQNPTLNCLGCDEIRFKCISCDIPMTINANEDMCLVWSVENQNKDFKNTLALQCQMNIEFKIEEQEEFGNFSKKCEISYKKPLVALEMSLQNKEHTQLYRGSSYCFQVTITPIGEQPQLDEISCILEDNEQWQYNDQVRCKTFQIENENRMSFTTQATPTVAGKLDYPLISLWRHSRDSLEAKDKGRHDSIDNSDAKSNKTAPSFAVQKLSSSRRKSANTGDAETAIVLEDEDVVFANFANFISVRESNKKKVTDV